MGIRGWGLVKIGGQTLDGDIMAVPETAVHEDAGAVFAQDDIGFAGQAVVVEAIAEAMMPQVATDDHLGFGVLALDRRHIGVPLLW